MTTKDGLNFNDLKTLYLIDKFDWRIDEYDQSEIALVSTIGIGTVVRNDNKHFDFMNAYLSPSDFYGSLSAAQAGFREELEGSRAWHEEEIERHRRSIAQVAGRLAQLEQETAIYLKPSGNRKIEKVGGIRIS